MRRLALAATAVVGVALFGTGVRGVTNVDGRLSEGADKPALREIDVRQKTRGPGDCPGRREHRDELPPRDELRL